MTDFPDLRVIDPLNTAARAVNRALTEALRPYGLSFAQFCMIDLIDRGGPHYPSSLARKLDIETSTMASTLKRAEGAGFIIRSPDPNDARGVVVTLTEHSREILPEARAAVLGIEEKCTGDLSGDERKGGIEFLQRIGNSLGM
ncbi:MarR family winged helix-turn-helix transcriptional regulator [Roseibaca calidilacus]|uniref:DNA-binding transcriptional regulator, MarR family n=2 Tax=Roseibaca calidilacus TaxID=1666912 RepID=A0ABP2BZA0_9RHOB|nr:MarR family transcriptional regulator [Roseibaca calidilacus]CUX83281.1 DNA-binding transcriptional regulator, MarR family [Roseibaca calidilacus]